jgi:hypothetical protein
MCRDTQQHAGCRDAIATHIQPGGGPMPGRGGGIDPGGGMPLGGGIPGADRKPPGGGMPGLGPPKDMP